MMKTGLLKLAALLAFTASLSGCYTLAIAQEGPSRVGRVAVTQGQVSIGGASGQSANAATVNWPITSRDLVTTATGARTELRFGSTTVRLDGDSALEVTELDDENMRLRLHYGSASVRVVNPDVLGGFELATPQGRVRMQQPGRVRVDAERVRDATSVSVFEGVALVDGGGASLTVRTGKRAELQDDNIRTAQAVPDAFDDWGTERDQAEATSTSSRYVSTEMTGREELDRYGSWTMDNDYGALWTPTVRPGWEPYRDGRYEWIQPWGWTWVDNAPWGYAPFHYGSWVYLNKRWAWAPGRYRGQHPAWKPLDRDWRHDDHRGRDRAGRDHRPRPVVTMPPPVLSQPRQPVMPNLPPPRAPITVLTPPPLQVQPAPQPQPRPGWRDERREQFEDSRRGRRQERWTETEVRPTTVAPPPVHARSPMPAAVAPPPAVAPNPMPRSVAQRPMPQPQLNPPVPRSVAQPVQMAPPVEAAMPAGAPSTVQAPRGPNKRQAEDMLLHEQ